MIAQRENLIAAIIVSHAVILVVQWAARKFTTLPKSGGFGIYLILLPIGFNCFGVDLGAWFVASFALAGLSVIFWSLRV